MIKDEKIKEEFEKNMSIPRLSEEEKHFADICDEYDMDCSVNFYAGFRAAERLAKIEVLEEIVSQFSYMLIDDTEDDYQCGRLSAAEDILETIKEKIEELKKAD